MKYKVELVVCDRGAINHHVLESVADTIDVLTLEPQSVGMD